MLLEISGEITLERMKRLRDFLCSWKNHGILLKYRVAILYFSKIIESWTAGPLKGRILKYTKTNKDNGERSFC